MASTTLCHFPGLHTSGRVVKGFALALPSGGPLGQLGLEHGDDVGVADLMLTDFGVGLLLAEVHEVVEQDRGGEGGDAAGGEELHGSG